jgi:hypothetical protein
MGNFCKSLICYPILVFLVIMHKNYANDRVAAPMIVLGPDSCATSGCHGGAGLARGQVVIWREQDPHARAYDTLVSARAERMGEALGMANVRTEARCTVCHAPAVNVPMELRAPTLTAESSVSCASCHGTGDTWLRTHTRPDLDHAAKIAAGLRELRTPEARADACVACHQAIEPDLVAVGRHPRLTFELDGMMAALPAHWRAHTRQAPAQAWFAGQAVALREAARALAERPAADASEVPRLAGLAWVVAAASGENAPPTDRLAELVRYGARQAQQGLPAREAPTDLDLDLLINLAGRAPDFRDPAVARTTQAGRAERLVLALDRLLAARTEERRSAEASRELDDLFARAQSFTDFEPEGFAGALERFAAAL